MSCEEHSNETKTDTNAINNENTEDKKFNTDAVESENNTIKKSNNTTDNIQERKNIIEGSLITDTNTNNVIINTDSTIVKENVITNPIRKTNLVLSGGGIKGIVHIGALYGLQSLGCLNDFTTFTGTSVGGVILALYYIGYKPAELYDFIKLFDLSNLKDISISNFQEYGLDSGSRLEYVIKRMIHKKGYSENVTLLELYHHTKKKIVFTTVCINTMELCYISHETFPHIPLYLAIKMTTAIPFYYCPVKYNNFYYVDGGCFDNYPIRKFKNELPNTLGVYIYDIVDVLHEIDNFEQYLFRLLETFMFGINYNLVHGYENETIVIDVKSINIIDYGIDDKLKDEMFMKGFNAIINNKKKIIKD